jgi:hypothetical protein
MNSVFKNVFNLTYSVTKNSAINCKVRCLSSSPIYPRITSTTSHKEVKKHAKTILEQHMYILNLISDTDYQECIDTTEFKTSSVGSHIRHSLDHLTWPIFSGNHLLNPFTNKDGSKIDLLSYDERTRKTAIETNRKKARCLYVYV